MEIKQIIVGKLQTNCYLFVSQKEAAVIDPGGEPGKILLEMEKTKAKIKYIINTHYHFDHVSANEELKEATGAEILIHEDEKNFISFHPDIFLKEGQKIEVGKEKLEVFHTPGHSKGGICLLGRGFIFSGDTLFDGSYGRVDLPGGSAEEMAGSLEKLAKVIQAGTTVYPGHGKVFRY
ncbi:MAG: MBL fold metallo-hydrolase [Candidatus Paceibacterota bacterium]|jgi:glyoxylase-like metal-dependent hydrolase (beta-lactamase superfamily II)|nr:MBL fold metallo-hydrolase [Candidatus Paceibacterota bacterium]MDD4830865.1 MBL fold metallo-hydrolase [Candidatus Paceibacterota bacterium]MDD4875098.1 MBL fold metallo-hydrolase [Candidatus Paceibacterota bacterium]